MDWKSATVLKAISAAALALPLLAQASRAAPEDCAAIEEDAGRLACFDRAFPRQVEPTAGGGGSWRLTSSPSILPNRTDRTASLASQNQVQCRWKAPRPVEMRIQCRNDVTSIAFETGCYMTSSTYRNYGNVSYSIEAGQSGVAAMSAGPDDRSLGLWSGELAIPFIKELLGRPSLSVTMTPFGDEPLTATFEIGGIDEAVRTVREECGW